MENINMSMGIARSEFQSAMSVKMSIQEFEDSYKKQCLDWIKTNWDDLQEETLLLYDQVLQELNRSTTGDNIQTLSFFWKKFHTIGKKFIAKKKQMKDKNFGLSATAFNEMVAHLQEGDKSLYEKVFLAHFGDCVRYLQQKYNASYNDAYDTAMNTLIEFHKKLIAGKINHGNLRFLFTQMAIHIYLKWIAKKPQQVQDLASLDLADDPPIQLKEEQDVALNKAWEKLCKDCQELLRNFYYKGINLKLIAEEKDKTSASIRKQKQRCLERLRDYFFQVYKP